MVLYCYFLNMINVLVFGNGVNACCLIENRLCNFSVFVNGKNISINPFNLLKAPITFSFVYIFWVNIDVLIETGLFVDNLKNRF